jgi:hypothetical protein
VKTPKLFPKHSDARRRGVFCVLLLFCAGGRSLPALAQVSGADMGGPPPLHQAGAAEPSPEMARAEHKLAERRNEERQKELEGDTRKLLELAQALHEDVAKTNKNELSLDVIKRAEQIEKLAHSVREKMRGYY